MQTINQFIGQWKDHGYEKGKSQKFWLDLPDNVMDHAEKNL